MGEGKLWNSFFWRAGVPVWGNVLYLRVEKVRNETILRR